MSGFGYLITGGADDVRAERVEVKTALDGQADLAWIHLTTTDDEAKTWLRDCARLEEDVVDALTADETRPRCEKFEHGALVNLRGRSKEEMTSSDPPRLRPHLGCEGARDLGHAQAADRDQRRSRRKCRGAKFAIPAT